MTMANLIVQRDRAYLMTDSGYFRRDGTIGALAPKSMVVEPLCLAMALTGSLHLGDLAKQMRGPSFTDVAIFLKAIPSMMRVAYAATGLDPDERWSRLLIAFYSPQHDKAYGCTLFTSAAPGAGPAGMQPWTILPAAKAIMPGIDEAAVVAPGVDMLEAGSFDPTRDAGPLIEAQRGHRYGGDGSAMPLGCYVAGDIDLTAVSARGVEVSTLRSYPDVVGSRAGR